MFCIIDTSFLFFSIGVDVAVGSFIVVGLLVVPGFDVVAGSFVVVGLPVVSGFGVAVGSSVVAGLFVLAGFCDETGFCVTGRMLAAFGVSVTYDAVSSFTMTIQVYFFFPAFACTLAFPDFTAAIMTLLFFLFLRRIQFFPETIFHLVFFLLFFKVMILLVPTVRVIFLLLNLIA